MTSNPHYEGDLKTAIQYKNVRGKDEILVYPRGLNIVWGNDDRYWDVPKDGTGPVELLQVCWLEVTGSVNAKPGKSYEVMFTLSLTPDAFGWGGSQIYAMAKWGKNGKFAWKKSPLTSTNGTHLITIAMPVECPADAADSKDDQKLYFGLYEVWSGKWKGGLRIHNVKIQEL